MAPPSAAYSTLLLLLLLSGVAVSARTISPIPAQHGRPNTNLVKSTCNSTTYYELCLAALAADPSSSTADVRGLCAIAVSAAAANASATASALTKEATTTSAATAPTSESDHASLLRSCAAKYGEAREALLAARESVGEEAYDYAFVHISAAAEYPAVCRTLFRRKREVYPLELARREEGLEHLCTIAIDIISLLAS